MKKVSVFLLGTLVGGALMVGGVAGASTFLKATPYNVKLVVDGKEAKLSEKPLTINGRAYLPVRDTANALGFNVSEVTSSKIELKNNGTSATNNSTNVNTNNSSNPSEIKKSSSTLKGEYVKDLKAKYSTNDKLDAGKLKAAIDKGEITVNAQDESSGDSLLQFVIKENNYEAYKIINTSKLNVNLQDNEGRTALHTTVIEKNVFYFSELKNLKANPKIKDKNGLMPIDYAEKNTLFEIGLEAYML